MRRAGKRSPLGEKKNSKEREARKDIVIVIDGMEMINMQGRSRSTLAISKLHVVYVVRMAVR